MRNRKKGEPFPCESGCGTIITPDARRSTRFCKACLCKQLARDPATRAKMVATMSPYYRDPALAHVRKERAAKATETKRADPEYMERLRAHGAALGASRKGKCCPPAGSPIRIAAARKTAERKLAWCPPAYRAEYTRLARNKHGMNAAEARRVIEAQIERDRDRANSEAPVQPSFEEKLAAVRSGEASIVPTFKPKKAMPNMTLGGVTGPIL
jgi:hypothetical protein